jgi:hypothetical protein
LDVGIVWVLTDLTTSPKKNMESLIKVLFSIMISEEKLMPFAQLLFEKKLSVITKDDDSKILMP